MKLTCSPNLQLAFKGTWHLKEKITSDVVEPDLIQEGLHKGMVVRELGPKESDFVDKDLFRSVVNPLYLDVYSRKKDLQDLGFSEVDSIVENIEPYDESGKVKQEYINHPVNLPNALPGMMANFGNKGKELDLTPLRQSDTPGLLDEIATESNAYGNSAYIPEHISDNKTVKINEDGTITEKSSRFHVLARYDGRVVTTKTETSTISADEMNASKESEGYFERVSDNKYDYIVKMIAADIELHNLLTAAKEE